MIYKYNSGDPYEIVTHVETILPFIGNIKEFEVYKNYDDTPFVSVEDNKKHKFTFIIKDDKEDEFWFKSLCGYNGSGPLATLKILQLLGIKKDFQITEEANIHIKHTNLKPFHKLNLVISTFLPNEYSYSCDRHHKLALSLDFHCANDKFAFIKNLLPFGDLSPVRENDPDFYNIFDTLHQYESPEYEYYYYSNIIFTLENYFEELDFKHLQKFLNSIIQYHNAICLDIKKL